MEILITIAMTTTMTMLITITMTTIIRNHNKMVEETYRVYHLLQLQV